MPMVVIAMALTGTIALIGVLWRKKPGWGKYDTQAVVLVIVATLLAVIAASYKK